MKKILTAIGLGLALLAANVHAEEKIAVVDVMSILQKMPQKDAVAKALKSEFQSRADTLKKDETGAKNALQKLQKSGASLSAAEKKKLQTTLENFDKKAEKFAQEYRVREAEEANKLLNRIQDAVKVVAKKDKYTLVLKAEAVFFANDAADITDKVLKQVK